MKAQGLHTAIVTPFTADGELDKASFLRLLDMQIDARVDGVVVCGSTGESATTTMAEKVQLWQWAVQHCAGKILVTAGTGTNDTRSTIELTHAAKQAGCDAALIVCPYYNKPSQHGIVSHYTAVANAVDIPIIMYNIQGRTGVNMTAETQVAIARACSNVIATKEASQNLEQMCQIIALAPEHFSVLAGDDSLALPVIACGATGVIAVISNYQPRTFGELIRAALRGDLATAQRLQSQLMPWYSVNFIEPNPIPVKYILHARGWIADVIRLPLEPATAATRSTLDGMLAQLPPDA